ncbi:MAG: hypothetical protein H6830_03095 [Planctomycetes bacterium]|nr:hypothetical protein [Planctomycetota bacterium]MCB9911336.1 hypothetical protein [Planctomycetota bacterium]
MWKPILASSLLLGLAACSGTRASQSSQTGKIEPTTQWLKPTPQLQQEMQMQIERMPWLKGTEESQNMIEWWSALGEAGYADLLKVAQDPRAKVADLAFAALAASRDKRLVPSLRAIPWDADAPMALQYSRARCHLRLGDWSHIDVLIAGLRDEVPYNRALCARILNTATNNDFGYHYNMPSDEREVAVQRWEAWYKERAPEALMYKE